ncbi:MAG: di-trans,poly-cis-decaprenylcistransferase [Polyangiaceae bacterium]|nr:di-trans,poly-cis-decaprenylcistransferase [Polyangiaceae bacterium]
MSSPTPPRHVAIILDGNGRWANARGLVRVAGHKVGADRVREVVRAAGEAGVEVLTVYALSLDNKRRPEAEVSALYELLERFAVSEERELRERGVRVEVVGDVASLPGTCQRAIAGLVAATSGGRDMLFRLAVAYGAREDLAQAVRAIAGRVQRGELSPGEITIDTVQDALWTRGAPNPDLVIRTGGDHRLSDFLLLECAYAELYFVDTPWPEFRAQDLHAALAAYGRRERRFGLVAEG